MLTIRPRVDRLAHARSVSASRRSRFTGGQPSPPPGFMNIRFAIALASVGALAFACSPRSRSTSQNSQPAAPLATALLLKSSATGEIVERPERSERARLRSSATSTKTAATSTKTAPKLDSHLVVTVQPTAIQFALGVKNVGKKHVELTFRSGQSYDFVVVDSVGREVWRWSAGRMFTQGVQNKQLERRRLDERA